jgi:hypothetical protein
VLCVRFLQVTALQIAALKRIGRGSKVLLLDRFGNTSKAVAKELSRRGFGRVFVVSGEAVLAGRGRGVGGLSCRHRLGSGAVQLVCAQQRPPPHRAAGSVSVSAAKLVQATLTGTARHPVLLLLLPLLLQEALTAVPAGSRASCWSSPQPHSLSAPAPSPTCPAPSAHALRPPAAARPCPHPASKRTSRHGDYTDGEGVLRPDVGKQGHPPLLYLVLV